MDRHYLDLAPSSDGAFFFPAYGNQFGFRQLRLTASVRTPPPMSPGRLLQAPAYGRGSCRTIDRHPLASVWQPRARTMPTCARPRSLLNTAVPSGSDCVVGSTCLGVRRLRLVTPSVYGPTFTLDNVPIERVPSINGGAVAKRPGPLINSPGPIRVAPCSL